MRPLSKVRPKTKKLNRKSAGHHSRESFEAIMADTTRTMPKYKRSFSTLIHSKAIWAVSDFISRTIARPNAILFGAILSFSFTIGVYLLSKNFGYSLSGSESIGAFLVGWVLGIAFDLASLLFKKR